MKMSILFGALALSAGAQAAGPVALLTPVSFAASTDARMEVRDECKLGDMLATRVGAALTRYTKSTGTTTSTDGDVVKVTVTTIWGARGNNWTGPKGLAIDADLMHDGKVERSTKMHRTTMGGFFGAFKGICSFMDRDAEGLAKEIAQWVRDPRYKPPAVEAAPDADAASPAASAASASGN
jgi:hypothetical protein